MTTRPIDSAYGGSREVFLSGLAAAARVRRSELVALGDDIVERTRVEVITPPRASAINLQVASTVGDFVLGKVVVTSATIRVDGVEAAGYVLGWDEVGALACAAAAAAVGTAAQVLASRALAEESERLLSADRAVRSTRVEFE